MTVAPVDCSPWSVSRPSRRSTCPPPCVPARAHDSALVTGGRRAPAGTGLLCAQFEEVLAVHQVAEGTGERVPDGSAQRTGRASGRLVLGRRPLVYLRSRSSAGPLRLRRCLPALIVSWPGDQGRARL